MTRARVFLSFSAPCDKGAVPGQTGEAREALWLFLELLLDRMRLLGADHPNTIKMRERINSPSYLE